MTQRLGIRYPIIQGPSGGGLSSVALAAAVSNGGGVGFYGARSTVLPRAFSGRLARGSTNRFIAEMQAADVPGYPFQNWLTEPIRRAAAAAGRPEYMSLWAGQAAALATRRPAAALLQALIMQTEQAFERLR